VFISVLAPRFGRLLTHLDVDDAGTDQAIEVLSAAFTGA
jgi:threonine aldolase